MPDDLRELMVRAWAHDAAERPTFEELAAKLDSLDRLEAYLGEQAEAARAADEREARFLARNGLAVGAHSAARGHGRLRRSPAQRERLHGDRRDPGHLAGHVAGDHVWGDLLLISSPLASALQTLAHFARSLAALSRAAGSNRFTSLSKCWRRT